VKVGWVGTVVVLGAVGALAYFVVRKTRTTSVPVGDLLGRVAWVQSDPLGWLTRDPTRIAEREEIV
jgi:hypothetical protein